VGAAAIISAGVDAVISDATSSFAFTSHLLEKNVPLPPLWVLVHNVRSAEWSVPAPLSSDEHRAVNEVHLFPGVPLLEQCPYLAAGRPTGFHATAGYHLEAAGKATLVTSIGDDPLPLFRFEIPVSLKGTGICDCGLTILERA
jgi:hypothetical protein